MKKGTKITLIIATICLVLGIIMSSVAFALANFDIRNLSTTPEYHAKTESISAEGVSDIVFNGSQENITVLSYAGDTVEFERYENDHLTYVVEERNGVLTITEKHDFVPRIFYFDFDMFSRSATLKIPASFKGSLVCETKSGGITIREIDALNTVSATSISGGIMVEQAGSLTSLSASSKSGAVAVISTTCGSLALSSTSGNIDVHGVEVYSDLPQSVSIESKSGLVFIDDTKAPTMQIGTASGRMACENVTVSMLNVSSSTGSVSLQHVYAETLSGKTQTGNIDALLEGGPEEYIVSATSRTGTVNIPSASAESLPPAKADKRVNLESNTGRILLEFTKEYAR